MPLPKSNQRLISEVVEAEVQRLFDKSCGKSCAACGKKEGDGLSDEDLAKLERLGRIAKYLVTPATAAEKAKFHPDELVADLKADRDPSLFPKRGPKAATSTLAMTHK